MIRHFLVPGLVLVVAIGAASMRAEEESSGHPEYEMTTYQFVMLLTGPNQQPLEEKETQELHQGHLDFMNELIGDSRVLIMGPISGARPLRGVVVFDVESAEEAEEILARDPMIRSARMKTEIHPWFAAKDILQKPTDAKDLRKAHLGMLKRPPDAPELPVEQLHELQKGHLDNINRMADSGDLVIAGPMADDGALRGLLVFRTEDESKIRKMVAKDPALQAGRLALKLYEWHVPRTSFPATEGDLQTRPSD